MVEASNAKARECLTHSAELELCAVNEVLAVDENLLKGLERVSKRASPLQHAHLCLHVFKPAFRSSLRTLTCRLLFSRLFVLNRKKKDTAPFMKCRTLRFFGILGRLEFSGHYLKGKSFESISNRANGMQCHLYPSVERTSNPVCSAPGTAQPLRLQTLRTEPP